MVRRSKGARRPFALAALLGMVVLALPARPALAQQEEIEKVNASLEVLRDTVSLPEKGVPEWLLSKAEGLAVIPGVIKAAYVLGGEYGKGIIMVRKADGRWSDPAFIKLAGGSVGWQIGVQRADIVLVFKSRESVAKITRGQFTLGATASVAAGPVGRSAEAGTDAELKAEIYSYSRSKGLFAGLALSGASLSIDTAADARFYGRAGESTWDILSRSDLKAPEAAARLLEYLDRVVR
jgi:lipid-binding SYLF domain-containing protein